MKELIMKMYKFKYNRQNIYYYLDTILHYFSIKSLVLRIVIIFIIINDKKNKKNSGAINIEQIDILIDILIGILIN
jgi:hypothetical protein